jgi:alpha-glucosidase
MAHNKNFSALIFLFVVLFTAVNTGAKTFTVASPDGKIKLAVDVTDKITYSVNINGREIIAPSLISMTVNDKTELGINPKIDDTDTKEVDNLITPVIKVKSSLIQDNYNRLRIDFKGKYSIEFRVYNDGTAYRFITSLNDKIKVNSETAEFNFTGNYNIYFPEEESFYTHQERNYLYKKLGEIGAGKFCSVPALVDADNNIKIAVTEADLFDYPGFYLTPSVKPNSLKCIFPGYPLEVEESGDRDVRVKKYADYLAETKGTREFPWRVLIITQKDADLIASQMIYKLASPSKIENTGWIKPGKAQWDWWNHLNVYGVDFKSGVNTASYKYYIDFASAHNVEYVVLDEGWYKLGNLLEINPAVDVHELIRYGKEKNVGIILWASWKTLNDNLINVLDEFQKWGVKGIKVDFMQRDDQWMVNYYERVAREAAKRHLLVDFHGAYKPTGLIRTYPNVLTSEGVKGSENNMAGNEITPEHMLILPFTRMVAGPMDFTPGSMENETTDFRSSWTNPQSQGTRCHEMALFVIYESPLEMLCDNPSNYLRETECLEFLSAVPTVWDTTIVPDAKVADYAIVARRSGNDWYIGAITDASPRDFTIDFSFLDSGSYKIEYYKDGINADRHPADYKKITADINSSDKLNIHLFPSGGWAARITRK